jgi:hypothetical protein
MAADAAEVQRGLDLVSHRGSVLDLGARTIQLPSQGGAGEADAVIPERALALVAGLDSYGD